MAFAGTHVFRGFSPSRGGEIEPRLTARDVKRQSVRQTIRQAVRQTIRQVVRRLPVATGDFDNERNKTTKAEAEAAPDKLGDI